MPSTEAKDKQLKDKAIKFKGKDYVQVADRVLYFNETYPNGSIQTVLVSEAKDDRVIIKAIVSPEPNRIFTGYSQARWDDNTSFVNKTSALENAETSAVGRALAMMGIGVIESIASIDEVNKAVNQEHKSSSVTPKQTNYEESVREPVNTLEVFCEVCGAKMKPVSGVNKTTGKPWSGYGCPNSTKENQHPLRFI